MLKVLSLLAVVALGGLWGLDRLERRMVYPFDPTRVDPGDIGLAMREERFESGGQSLVLWLAEPRPGRPVVLYFHGNAGNLAARAGRFRLLLEQGFGLVAMGYRGSSGSSGTPSEAALSLDAARLLARLGDYAGAAPVVVYGESLGCAVAIAAIARAGVEPAGVVLEAPFTSAPAVALAADPRLAALAGRMKNRWDSLARAGALQAPLLVLHGSEDELIPIDMGRQVYAAAPSQRKHLLEVKGGHHTDLWRSDVLPVLWRFIAAAAVP